ncbi:hypothetical protein [Blastococcus montanus]|uniref:hypothetical protein n=1 Tax=Blastococcus montanus TaxID=3144973 RepID=UPI00320A67AF
MTSSALSRRRFLVAGAGVLTAAVVASAPGLAAAAPPAGPRPWTRGRSANGWPVLGTVDAVPIEGSDLTVRVAGGDVALILTHVARRFHYDIDGLRVGDLTGHASTREVTEDYESNYLSGTAIAIRAGGYPLGASGNLYPNELIVVRDILAECDGVVRWGGDERVPKESHFQIDRGPNDKRVRQLADKIRSWEHKPSQGAGTVDPFSVGRREAARDMERQQTD